MGQQGVWPFGGGNGGGFNPGNTQVGSGPDISGPGYTGEPGPTGPTAEEIALQRALELQSQLAEETRLSFENERARIKAEAEQARLDAEASNLRRSRRTTQRQRMAGASGRAGTIQTGQLGIATGAGVLGSGQSQLGVNNTNVAIAAALGE